MKRADTVAKLVIALALIAGACVIFYKRTHPPAPEWASEPVTWDCLPCGGTFKLAGWADACPDCAGGSARTDVPEDWICTGYRRMAAGGEITCSGSPVQLHGYTGPPPSVIHLREGAPQGDGDR